MSSPTVGQLKRTFNTTRTPIRWRSETDGILRENRSIATIRDLAIVSGQSSKFDNGKTVPDKAPITIDWVRKILNVNMFPLSYNGAIPTIKLSGSVNSTEFNTLASYYSGGDDEIERADGPLVYMHTTFGQILQDKSITDDSSAYIECVFVPDITINPEDKDYVLFGVLYCNSSTQRGWYASNYFLSATDFMPDTIDFVQQHLDGLIAGIQLRSCLRLTINGGYNPADYLDIYTVGSIYKEDIVQTFCNHKRFMFDEIVSLVSSRKTQTLDSVYNTKDYDYVNFLLPPSKKVFQLEHDLKKQSNINAYNVLPIVGVFAPIDDLNYIDTEKNYIHEYMTNQPILESSKAITVPYKQQSVISHIEYTNKEGYVVPAESISMISYNTWNEPVYEFYGNGFSENDAQNLIADTTTIYVRHMRIYSGIITKLEITNDDDVIERSEVCWTDVYKLNGRKIIYKKPYRTLLQNAYADNNGDVLYNSENVIPNFVYMYADNLQSKSTLLIAKYKQWNDISYVFIDKLPHLLNGLYNTYFNMFGRYGFDQNPFAILDENPVYDCAVIGKTKEDSIVSVISYNDFYVGGLFSEITTRQAFYPPSIGLLYPVMYKNNDYALTLYSAFDVTPKITIKGVVYDNDDIIEYIPSSRLNIASDLSQIEPSSNPDQYVPLAIHYIHDGEEYLLSTYTDGLSLGPSDNLLPAIVNENVPLNITTSLFGLECTIPLHAAVREAYDSIIVHMRPQSMYINKNKYYFEKNNHIMISANGLEVPWFMYNPKFAGEYTNGEYYGDTTMIPTTYNGGTLCAIHVYNDYLEVPYVPITLRFAINSSRWSNINNTTTFYLSNPTIDYRLAANWTSNSTTEY